MDWKKELASFFKENEEFGVELLRELVAQNTINPPGNEYLVANVLKKYLDAEKISYVEFEKTKGRTNLIATVGKGSPALFVPAHADVVPVNDDWTHNPFEMKIEDGVAYGRGVGDDKGPMVSAFLLLLFLKRHEAELKGTYIFGSVADEEVGSSEGLVYLLDEGLIKADYAVVPDTGTSIYQISHGEKGLVRFCYTFNGVAGHSAYPELSNSAIWPAWEFTGMIKEAFGERIGYCREPKQKYFSETTITVSGIEAFKAYNIVPRECQVKLDIRYTPQRKLSEIKGWLDECAKKACEKYQGTSFEVVMPDQMDAFEIETKNPLCRAASQATKELTGKEAEFLGMNGTTVCKQLVKAGILAIGYSSDDLHTCHMTGEHMKLSEIPLLGQALGLLFNNLCESPK